MLVIGRNLTNRKTFLLLDDYITEALKLQQRGVPEEKILEILDTKIEITLESLKPSGIRLGFLASDKIKILREEIMPVASSEVIK